MTTHTFPRSRPRPLRQLPAAAATFTRTRSATGLLRTLLHTVVAASVPIDGAWLPPQPRPSTPSHPEPRR